MRWEKEGLIISVRKYGENSALLEVFTESLGKRVGLLKGALSKKNKTIIQPGNQVFINWNSRIEDGLGNFKIELIKSRFHIINGCKTKLTLFNQICIFCSIFLSDQ